MRVIIFICVHLIWGGLVAHAQDLAAQQGLERAQICIDALDYECAQQELAKARALSQTLAPEEKARLHELGAVTALSLGEQAAAEEELRKLLELRPDYEPQQGSWPPNWLNVLQRVRKGMPDRRPPRIVAPEQVAPGYTGHDWSMRIRVLDPGGVAAVTLFLRVEGEMKNISLATSDGENWKCTVPAQWVNGEALLYWVEAYDRSGNGPSKHGSIDEPLTLKLGEKVSGIHQPVYKKWWFWTAIGGVVAAGGATFYLMSGSGESVPPIQTGNIDVEIQWPSP
jgi:tetratricopeptide (TPR) repeat protein